MIEKNVTFEGILREDEIENEWKAKLEGYGVEAITKPGIYTLVEAMPYDFSCVLVGFRITEAFDGTIDLGIDANHSKILADANFIKTVGSRDKTVSVRVPAGNAIRLYLGAGTTGKIEIKVAGFLWNTSLL
jgi:hypothetical protein